MKKIFTIVTVILATIVVVIYILIPTKMSFFVTKTMATSTGTLERLVGTKSERAKWIVNEENPLGSNQYFIKSCTLSFPNKNSFEKNIIVEYKDIRIACTATSQPIDSLLSYNWAFTHSTTLNPITRIKDYSSLKHIEKVLTDLQTDLGVVANNKKAAYGFDIQIQKLTDSTIITLRENTNQYPSVDQIYAAIDKLNNYALEKKALPTNVPMLNVSKINKNSYSFLVALPVNKDLSNEGNIVSKRMFAGGKVLVSDSIMGDIKTIENAIVSFENYKTDVNFMSPAIAYQSLITNRQLVRDSTTWITKLYYPVY